MGLSTQDLAEIDGLFAGADGETQAIEALRRRFPSLSLTRCDASDVDAEQPFRQYPAFNLYLVDAADHCWRLTSDPERATGLVMAGIRSAS